MKWYVLYVSTASEIEIRDKLREMGLPAMVPRAERPIRHGGKWHIEQSVIYPGYVFLGLEKWDSDLYYRLKRDIDGIIKVLYNPCNVVPIYDYEAEQLLTMCSDDDIMEMSDILIKGKYVKVMAGALKGMKGSIIEIMPRQRRVRVKLSLMGAERIVTMGANIITSAKK